EAAAGRRRRHRLERDARAQADDQDERRRQRHARRARDTGDRHRLAGRLVRRRIDGEPHRGRHGLGRVREVDRRLHRYRPDGGGDDERRQHMHGDLRRSADDRLVHAADRAAGRDRDDHRNAPAGDHRGLLRRASRGQLQGGLRLEAHGRRPGRRRHGRGRHHRVQRGRGRPERRELHAPLAAADRLLVHARDGKGRRARDDRRQELPRRDGCVVQRPLGGDQRDADGHADRRDRPEQQRRHGTSAGTFTFLAPPTISSFTPDGVFGAPITITGSDFTGTTSVLIGGASARFTVKSPTEIDTTVPTTASNTPQPISVTNAGGTTLSSTDFTLDWAQPVVSSFTPASARPGATVTIDGSSFTGANDVEFDGHAALNPKIVSDTKITAVVPLDVGTAAGAVSVDNPGGTAGTSATNFTPLWPQPVVSSFSPAKAAAGATVTITGKNLLGETNVAFNGHTASISGTPT